MSYQCCQSHYRTTNLAETGKGAGCFRSNSLPGAPLAIHYRTSVFNSLKKFMKYYPWSHIQASSRSVASLQPLPQMAHSLWRIFQSGMAAFESGSQLCRTSPSKETKETKGARSLEGLWAECRYLTDKKVGDVFCTSSGDGR